MRKLIQIIAILTFCSSSIAYSQLNCVDSLDVSIIDLDTTYYTNNAEISLTGEPANGVFYGRGVKNGKFYPSYLKQGEYTIAYVYIDSLGCSVAICETVKVVDNTSIDTTNSTYNIIIAPNPSDGVFTLQIDLTTPSVISVVIMNLVGSIVYSETQENISNTYTIDFNLSHLVSGVYFVKVGFDDGIVTRKIIIE